MVKQAWVSFVLLAAPALGHADPTYTSKGNVIDTTRDECLQLNPDVRGTLNCLNASVEAYRAATLAVRLAVTRDVAEPLRNKIIAADDAWKRYAESELAAWQAWAASGTAPAGGQWRVDLTGATEARTREHFHDFEDLAIWAGAHP